MAKLEDYPARWDREWRAACEACIEAALAVQLGALSDLELRGHFDELCELLTAA